jgi:cytochrome c
MAGSAVRVVAALIVALGMSPALSAHADLSGHGGPVRSLAVSSDGAMALTGGFDYSIMLWDLQSSRELSRMTAQDAAVGAVAFLGPDRLLSASDDGSLALWDRAGGRLLERKPAHGAKIAALALSTDGASLASAGWDRKVRLWRATDLLPLSTIAAPDNVNALAFTADGLLAGGGYDAALRLWDAGSGREVELLSGHEAGINALLALPGGRIASASSDRTVRLWDVAQAGEAGVLLGAEAAVLSLAASPDGAWIAAGDAQGFVTVWNSSGELLRRWRGHGGPAWALALAGARKTMLSAGADGLVRSWPVGPDGPSGADITDAAPPLAALTTSADPGERLFAKCAACHTLTPEDGNKAGPTLYGLFGRRAGSVAGYPYSPALRNSSIVWTEQTVDRLFALGPHIVTPGSKMPLQRMADPSERAALIAYLRRRTQP